MFTHLQIWNGIDRLAREKGWTPSRLAREAGLDPTTFNKSKRHTNQAKPRWPSTESLAKILDATNTSFEHFVTLMADHPLEAGGLPSERLRCVGTDDAGDDRLFDEAGFPIGTDWDEIDFPGVSGKHAYALEVRGDRLLPAYRDGELLIVSPGTNVRRQDRVVLKTAVRKIEVGILRRRTVQRVELECFGEEQKLLTLSVREILWLSRIIWASQ